MEFVLVYDGDLPSNGGPDVKQRIRRCIHPQLKILWQQKPLLSHSEKLLTSKKKPEGWSNLRDVLPFTFAPLATEETRQMVELDILFLRPEEPGSLITQGGDIDNRLKTLFDALRMRKNIHELPNGDAPARDESPFYCLLEDDNLITRVNVRTDRLLNPNAGKNTVFLVIHVNTKVTETIIGNIGLA